MVGTGKAPRALKAGGRGGTAGAGAGGLGKAGAAGGAGFVGITAAWTIKPCPADRSGNCGQLELSFS